MIIDTMRPDDQELMIRAARQVRRETSAAVAFGGLRAGNQISISTTAGARTNALTSIVVHPSRGLGGLSWQSSRPLSLPRYDRAPQISHDFDRQILGEGITALSAAPIIVGRDVRGLIYAGHRASATTLSLETLVAIADAVAEEIRIRDLVDERLKLHQRPFGGHGATSHIRSTLAALADETQDPETARKLRNLLEQSVPADAPESEVTLTARQQSVLELVAHGLRNKQIADRLALSEPTVKSYLRAAMTRLGAQSRLQAVVEAQRRGMI